MISVPAIMSHLKIAHVKKSLILAPAKFESFENSLGTGFSDAMSPFF
jgi:hypothetical protein